MVYYKFVIYRSTQQTAEHDPANEIRRDAAKRGA